MSRSGNPVGFHRTVVRVASLILACGLCSSARAVVISGNISFQPDSMFSFLGANYRGGIAQSSDSGDLDTSVWFKYTATYPRTLEAITWNVDEESDWYLAAYGTPFTSQSIVAGQFTPIFTLDSARPAVQIPIGDFYLGVNTGLDFVNGHPARDVFGWVKLRMTSSGLTMLDSAVAYGEQGIYIGTTTAVPEPAALALWMLGGMGLLQRRRVQEPAH